MGRKTNNAGQWGERKIYLATQALLRPPAGRPPRGALLNDVINNFIPRPQFWHMFTDICDVVVITCQLWLHCELEVLLLCVAKKCWTPCKHETTGMESQSMQ